MRTIAIALLVACGTKSTAPTPGSGTAALPAKPQPSPPAPPPVSSCDISTDAKLRAVYRQAAGEDLGEKLECVQRSQTFAGLVTIGSFAHDRGCMREGILYDCKWNDRGTPSAAMARAGWKSGDTKRRRELALAWLREVEHESIVETEPADFAKSKKTFAPVTVREVGAGLELTFWSQEPSGMLPEANFNRYELVFGPDGVAGPGKRLDHATIAYH